MESITSLVYRHLCIGWFRNWMQWARFSLISVHIRSNSVSSRLCSSLFAIIPRLQSTDAVFLFAFHWCISCWCLVHLHVWSIFCISLGCFVICLLPMCLFIFICTSAFHCCFVVCVPSVRLLSTAVSLFAFHLYVYFPLLFRCLRSICTSTFHCCFVVCVPSDSVRLLSTAVSLFAFHLYIYFPLLFRCLRSICTSTFHCCFVVCVPSVHLLSTAVSLSAFHLYVSSVYF